MSYFYRFIALLLLITTSSLYALPRGFSTPCLNAPSYPIEQEAPPQPTLFSYDNVLEILERLESGELEQTCGPEELEKLNHFLAGLAKEGVLPSDDNIEVLESDIDELLEGDLLEFAFDFERGSGFVILPAVYGDSPRIVPCNWVSKNWRRTKKFVHKHKTAILIGAAVVVAVTVVVVVAAASSASAAAASAAAAKAVTSDKKESEKERATPTTSVLAATAQAPELKTTIEEHISSLKEYVSLCYAGESPPAIQEPAKESNFSAFSRELGSMLAHETLEGISSLVGLAPQLQQELLMIGKYVMPESLLEGFSPQEKYEALITAGHIKIDQVFATDRAQHYGPEAHSMEGITYGALPPPGHLYKVVNVPKLHNLIRGGQSTTALAESFGYTEGQILQLEKAGTLESTVQSAINRALCDKKILESYSICKKAEKFLKPYHNRYMPEDAVRQLIHKSGIQTFPRPSGIPNNYKVRVSDKGAGIVYRHPTNEHISIRVMPGKPHSDFPHQQNPYVIQAQEGRAYDKWGNLVPLASPEAHIPLEEFIYRSN